MSPRLDKFSSQSIKCVFVRYFRTQKGYRCYNPSTRKYLASADVTFFEFVTYFSSRKQNHVTTSEIIPLPLFIQHAPSFTNSSLVPLVDTLDPPALKPIRDFRYIYTHRQKISASEPAPAEPSPVDGPPPQSSASSSDLDTPLPFAKVNDLALIILSQGSFSIIILTLIFACLLYPYLQTLYPGLVRRLYWHLPRSRP